jgi:hypothetical protein
MEIIYDPQSEYWSGQGWLVIKQEGEPAIASFKTKTEAEQFVKNK